MRLKHCFNYHDFRKLARRRCRPIFNYIDGAADDETTYRRNTAAFEECDLGQYVLRGTGQLVVSRLMGRKLAGAVLLLANGPAAAFHQKASAGGPFRKKFGTMF